MGSATTYSRYRHLAIESTEPPPTPSELMAIEALLEASLPEAFRNFLAVANGANLEYLIDVPIGGGKTEALSFCRVFSTRPGELCDETFIGEIRSGREYAKIPHCVLPFARDGGGSCVYLDLSNDGHGRVIAFVVGLPEWTGLRTESAFVELATSFDDYVAKLYVDRSDVVRDIEEGATTSAHIEATLEWLAIALPDWRDDPRISTALQNAKSRLTKQ